MATQVNHQANYRGINTQNMVRLPPHAMNSLLYRPQNNHHIPMVQYLHGPPPPRNVILDEEDLGSVSLQVQKKRFYVDVKKNRKGMFMKIAEVGFDGRKARIILTLHAAFEVKDKLKDLIDTLSMIEKKDESDSPEELENSHENEPKASESPSNDGLIKSHVVNYSYRRYFLDLKKNHRGYFLRLTMMSSLTRIQLAVPSQGMSDLYDAINHLLEKWWEGPKPTEIIAPDLPDSKSLRVDNKTLYFDSSYNRYGTFLRISEVRSNSRTAITIPGRSLSRFKDIINELTEDLAKVKVTNTNDEETEETVSKKEDEADVPNVNGDAP